MAEEPTVTQLIHDLRVKAGELHDKLTRLELEGNREAAISALWATYYLWAGAGTEYAELEALIKKGNDNRQPVR